MALMDGKARYQMRFHNLCDSLIIMDEVQTLPCKLWVPLNNIFKTLVERGNSKILAMSATLPGLLSDTTELIDNYQDYFRQFGRYRLILKHQQSQSLDAFCRNIGGRLSSWIDQGLRVLITLNTRSSAREVRDFLEQEGLEPLFFISADVTPRDRLRAIKVIKENKPCFVVSTQCVEAGVDIDLDLVIRDFAPLDSIIQIAGRCNRNFKKSRCDVEVVSLVNSNGRLFCEIMGYDPIHLQETRIALSVAKEINEENILDYCNRYFASLTAKKDTGTEITEYFARWKEIPSVRELLRGKEHEQYHFLVIEQDPELKRELESAVKISDKWERRRTLRSLTGRMALIEVSIYAKPGFDPEDIADRCGNMWLLHEGIYSAQRGLEIKPNLSVGTLIL